RRHTRSSRDWSSDVCSSDLGSPSTPQGGLEAEIVRFANMAELEAAPNSAVAGRTVFIDERMTRSQDGSGYGAAVAKRGRCAPVEIGRASCSGRVLDYGG